MRRDLAFKVLFAVRRSTTGRNDSESELNPSPAAARDAEPPSPPAVTGVDAMRGG